MTEIADEQMNDEPGTPWGFVAWGVFLAVIGTGFAFLPNAPTVARLIGFALLTIAGILAQVGIIAVGVEYGMRRVQSR